LGSPCVQPDATAAANVGLDEVIDASRARRLAAVGWAVERDLCSAFASTDHTPHEINVASCTLYQAEGMVLVRWEGSEAIQAPSLRRPRASCSAVALCLIRRAPLAIGARSAPRTIAINSQTPCAPFLASAARHNKKTKHLLQSTPAKRRRRAPSRAPNRCKNLPQRITHENREPWPTPTNQLNRSRRPRRRKKKRKPRPPP
jgi:hypothetical protein